MITLKQIGERLRTLRDGISLSQAKLAELLGITQSSLNRYENGQSTPTVELFRKYADFFDVSSNTPQNEKALTVKGGRFSFS